MTSYASNFTLSNIKLATTWTASAIGIPWAGDLNGDGFDDLIVTGASYPPNGNIPQQGGVFFGDGKGGFIQAAPGQFPIDALKTVHPRQIISADFNNDGRPDIFIASHGYDTSPFPGEQNQLYLSQANGSWIDATANLPQLLDFSHTVAVGDINGDGNQDVYVGNVFGQNRISPYILLGNGAGGFTQTSTILPSSVLSLVPNTYTSSLLTDLNGDGKPDLVLGLSGGPQVTGTSRVFWNTGAGFDDGHVSILPATAIPNNIKVVESIAMLDINNDGRPDLITLSTTSNVSASVGADVDVFLNSGSNTFTAATNSVISGTSATPGGSYGQFLRIMDINSDGLLDVIVTYPSIMSPDEPVFYINDGKGHLVSAALSDITSTAQFAFFPIHTTNGISYVKLFTSNGALNATELLATFPIPPATGAIVGTAGADRLVSSNGNDSIDGSGGVDAVLYHGPRSGYVLTLGATPTVSDLSTGRDGTDSLANIERVRFSDTIVALDTSGNAGQTYRMYQAAFARTPDKDGVSFWVSQVDKGLSLHDLASSFIGSAEFKGIYGANPTIEKLVTGFYTNVLGRAPDSSGLAFWVGQVQGGLSTSDLLVNFSESGENKAHVAPAIQNGIELSLSLFA